jgi:outer membrane protein TolC
VLRDDEAGTARGMMVFRKVATIALVLAGALGASAQSLTLPAAAAEALARNPAIAAAGSQQAAASARLRAARSAWLPRVDVSESVTHGNNPVFVFGSLLEQGRFTAQRFDPAFLNAPDALTNYRTAIAARFALFDQFRARTDVRRSENTAERASIEAAAERQRVLAEVIARFYGVVLAEEKAATAREAVRSAEAGAKKVRDRFEQGLCVESDALSADVQLASFRQRVIAAEGDVAVARAALAMLLQRPWSDPIVITGSLPISSIAEPDRDTSVARAVARASAVKAAARSTSDSELHVAAERATALPRVDAFGTLGASGTELGRRNSDHTVGIAVTLELFDRARPARVAAARADLDTARAGEAIARDAATIEAVTLWHRLHAARESAVVAERAVTQAEAAARIVGDRYEQGLTTITEQLNAQSAVVTARFELLAARYEAVIAKAELLRATGDLDDVQSFL